MSQLVQRVSAEYTSTLNLFETMGYLLPRGAGRLHPRTVRRVVPAGHLLLQRRHSRVINTLCDGALVYAYGSDKDTVNMDIVLDVVKAKQIGGIHRPGIDTDPNRENRARRRA